MKHAFVSMCLLVFLTSYAYARPISYPGGTTVMQMTDGTKSSLHLHYSPSITYSFGYKFENWRDDDWQFHGLQANYLLKRWNRYKSQANAYWKSAIGLSVVDNGASSKEAASGFVGFATDWENRRFFVSYENRFTYLNEPINFFSQKARVGVAPYIGNYGDVHTWFMLQVDHEPEQKNSMTFASLVRFFKSDYLIELGLDENEKVLFNFIVRF